MADNSPMAADPAGPAGAPGPLGPLPAGSEVRDRYVTVLLNAFERSLVTPDEYSYRLGLLESARTEAEMRRILQEMAIVGMAPATGPAGGAPGLTAEPMPPSDGTIDLDAIERAFLAQTTARRPRRSGNRWAAVVVVGVIFLALLVMGVVLATTVHPAPAAPGGTVGLWL